MTEKFLIPVELPGDASSALHAVPKQQLDPTNSQIAVIAAQQELRRLADLGQYILSGCTLTANATPTKLDMAVGVVFIGTAQLPITAQTAINKTIAQLASDASLTAGQSVWVVVEINSSNVVVWNSGAGAAAPVFPTINTTNVVLGLLWVPYGATNVDTLLTTPNGNAKLIDAAHGGGVVRGIETGIDVQYFTTAGAATWTKPANAITVEVICMGAGGGGGSGRQGANSTARYGGGGGASGNFTRLQIRASALASTVTVTVGTGGAGGAGASTTGTTAADGTVGTTGTGSSFGTHAIANGGFGGVGGTTALGTGGATNIGGQMTQGGLNTGASGTGAGLDGVNGNGTAGTLVAAGGGGGGGGLPAANTVGTGGRGCIGKTGWDNLSQVGGAGGTAASPTTTGSGGGGGNGAASGEYTGSGGGGGASGGTTSGTGGTGGNGGPTAGGGGGGAATTGSHAGAGGNGGDGIVIVITHRA